jgi:peptidoglycan/LPS O-acetylase OafA/YrhL
VSGSLAYRADIDGLRAIAVLAVVLYHAKVGPFTGGYVGVDVFFVISGYLISSMLVKEMSEGSFSFAGFYERRIRRIFPALFTVVFASIAAGWFILTPQDYKEFGLSVVYIGAFLSNVFFMRRAGYFAPVAETQPLLHTWSLAVEEQFYVIAPLALLALYRFAWQSRAVILLMLAAASLVSAAYGVSHEWPSAFFLLHSRAWELMTGVLLGVAIIPPARTQALAEALGCIGLVMIFAAILLYSPVTSFPGFAALLPCLGAGLVIHSGAAAPTVVQRILATQPLVFTGKISYSLYLWHWPILAFAAYASDGALGAPERLALIAIAILLSIGTWAVIEQPARQKRGDASQKRVFASALVALAASIVIGFGIKKTDGIIMRLSPEAQAVVKSVARDNRYDDACSAELQKQQTAEGLCVLGDPHQATASFVLWGDSHAATIATELSAIASKAALRGTLVATGGCPPLLGLEDVSRRTFSKCIDHNIVVANILKQDNLRHFILDARWALYSEGRGSGGEIGVNVRRFADGDLDKNRAEFARLFRETLKTITASGRRPRTAFQPAINGHQRHDARQGARVYLKAARL